MKAGKYPKVIGVMGKKFHGKDTVADHIVKNYGHDKISFADPLKEGCRQIFGLDDEQLYGSKKETIDEYWGVKPRTILQYVGTDLFRNQLMEIIPDLGKNVWIKRMEKTFIDNPDKSYIVADVRFPNELEMIERHGGIVIKVNRPNQVSGDTHASETNIDKMDGDVLIQNDSTLDELYHRVNMVMNDRW
jgi:hypothetical protein